MAKKLSKEDIALFNALIENPEASEVEKKIAREVLAKHSPSKEIPTRVQSSAKKPAPKKATPKKSKKPTLTELEKKKMELLKKTGKTEEECEKIIAQYRALKTKEKKQVKKDTARKVTAKKRTTKLKKEGKTIQGTTEKNVEATLDTASKKVVKKIDKEVEKIEKTSKTEKQVEKKISSLVTQAVRSNKKLLSDTAKELAKVDKNNAKQYLMSLKKEIDSLLSKYAHGGMMHSQGYNDRLNESLGNRNRTEPMMMQSFKDRRDESKGMEKAMGRRPYSSVGTMDMMAKGGKIAEIRETDLDEYGIYDLDMQKFVDKGFTMSLEAENEAKNLGYEVIDGTSIKAKGGNVYALVDGFDEPTQNYDQVYFKTDDYNKLINYVADLKNEREYYSDDMTIIEVMPSGKMRKFDASMFAKGGKIGFDGLARKVAKRYEGEPVPKRFQKEYGKTYSKEEALEVGQKVAGKVLREQNAKMEAGGTLPTPFGQAGLVGETGTLNEVDLFAMGGTLPQGVHQYYAQTYNPAYPTPFGYAMGGNVDEGKVYELKAYFVDVEKDSFDEGVLEDVQSWDSGDFGQNNMKFYSKQDLYNQLSRIIYRDTDKYPKKEFYGMDEDSNGNVTLTYDTLSAYKNDNYVVPSDLEVSLWKQGEMELFNVRHFFVVDVYKKERLEFAKGGMTPSDKNAKIISELEKIKSEVTDRPPYVYERDGQIFVSSEEGDEFSDYYGEYYEPMYVDKRLEAIAKKNGGYWEWENAGAIGFVDESYAKGGMMQGYNDRLNESLGNRNRTEPMMMQSFKDRRDESKGMEKSMGRRPYSSVGTMDKMAKGGKTQGYNDKLNESLGSSNGKRSKKQQNYKDRRNESEAMEKKGGKRKYSRVKTMDKGNRKKRKTPMTLAKEIRKEGEKWQDAVKRASAMLKNK